MGVIGAVLAQPPLAVLVQQAALMYMTMRDPGFCHTQLATSPLSRARLANLWQWLEAVAPAMAPSSGPDAGAALARLPGGLRLWAVGWNGLGGWR